MRRLLSLTVAICVFLMGLIFRFMHWPGSNVLFIIAAVLIVLYLLMLILRK